MQAAEQDEHGLSAYERERLETIRNNNRVLVDLGLGPATGAAPTSSTYSRTVAPRRSKREPSAPGRVSSRLAAAKAPQGAAEEAAKNRGHREVERAKVWMKHHHFESGGGATSGIIAPEEEAAHDPLVNFRAGYMPESVDDLLEGEFAAYKAVYEAVRARWGSDLCGTGLGRTWA